MPLGSWVYGGRVPWERWAGGGVTATQVWVLSQNMALHFLCGGRGVEGWLEGAGLVDFVLRYDTRRNAYLLLEYEAYLLQGIGHSFQTCCVKYKGG